jgi:DNA-binding NtrC family response regulator
MENQLKEEIEGKFLTIVESLQIHHSLTEIALILAMPIEMLQARLKYLQEKRIIENQISVDDTSHTQQAQGYDSNRLQLTVKKSISNSNEEFKLSERDILLAAIRSSESRVEAAKKLGISPRTLRYKLAQIRESGILISPDEYMIS